MSNDRQIFVPLTAGVEQYKRELTEAATATKSAGAAIASSVDGIGKSNQKSAENVRTLRQEMRAQFNDAQKLAQAYGINNAATIEAAKASGQYKDKLGELTMVQNAFASDTPALTSTLGLMQSLSGVVTTAAGAYGLLGVKSEDVQRALLMVQSAMAVTTGLIQIGQLADAYKAFRIVMVAEVLPSILAVNGALLASGIGLAIAAISALVYWWQSAANATELAKMQVFDYAATLKAVTERHRKNIDAQVQSQELYIRTMEEGKAKEVALNDMAMQKELRDNLRAYQDKEIMQNQFENNKLFISEYYAKKRQEIDKKYAPKNVQQMITIDTRMSGKAGADAEFYKQKTDTLKKFRAEFYEIARGFQTIPLGDFIAYPLTQAQTKIKEFTAYFNDVGQNLLAPALTSVFTAIGNSIVNGGNVIENAGKALLGVLGQWMVQLGSQMIIIGVLGESFKASIASMQWYAAVGIGVALVAAGSVLSALASSGPGGGSTPSASGSGDGMSAGFYGASLAGTVDQTDLSTKIRGRDLFLSNNRSRISGARFGGM
jgi:hypothetical protein